MWLGSGSAWSVLDPNYWPVEAFPLPSSNQASALTGENLALRAQSRASLVLPVSGIVLQTKRYRDFHLNRRGQIPGKMTGL